MMEQMQTQNSGMQTQDSFTEKWFSEELSLVTGLFRLEYDGQWHCAYISDDCLQVLACSRAAFLETLRDLAAHTTYHAAPRSVGQMLDEMAVTEKSGAYISIRLGKDGTQQYIKGTLAVSRDGNGLLCVHGQVTDVSGEQQRDVRSQSVEEQGKANQQIFRIVAQHSNRILYAYDLASGTTRPWDEDSRKNDILAHLYTGQYTEDGLEKNEYVLQDSMEDVKNFFMNIHSGEPSGDLRIHIRLTDGQLKWYHFKYSSIFHDGKPVTALISVEDVTERHEHEMAYKRYIQSMEDDAEGYFLYIESDLTADRIEKVTGQFVSMEEKPVDCSHSDFGPMMLDLKFRYDDAGEASEYFSCENLMTLYHQGEKLLRSEWKVVFLDNRPHWLDTKIVLVEDPYNNHIKALIRMLDITEKQEKHLSVLKRADFDAMTGLLRKDAGEDRIKEHMADNDGKGGILIVLDLDDLKGINDTLGHKAGDAAIIGIADTLKSHFRRDDVLIRAGGDEFMAFLPGAGQSISSVELSMTKLLQKLSGITVGEENERMVHCSAGCAVELPGTDSFETMFKRADTALYHVKRSGKNNFAFYVPEMTRADFEFKAKQFAPEVTNVVKTDGINYLLEVMAKFYPEILLLNLSKNHYNVLRFSSSTADFPLSGSIELLWKSGEAFIHPDDREDTAGLFSREELLTQYARGKDQIRHYYRNMGSWGNVRMEIVVHFIRTDIGDICAFLLIRTDTAAGRELELLRMRKLLELTSSADIEYICLIDVYSRKYSTFNRSHVNSHAIPETADFDMVTKHIRDTQILPEDREEYYEKAQIGNVIKRMNEPEGKYAYRYTMLDGITREAEFYWYEETHFELIMIVRKLI